jgi:CHAT domain-containing protein
MPEPGERATLRADEPHARALELTAGTFLRVEVEQFGIDLRLSLFDPQGDELAWADSPTGPSGPEELVAVAPTAGTYRLQVKAPKAVEPGEYAVRSLETRPADSRDRRWAEAEAGYWAARLRVKAEQYDEAIPELRRLIPLWQELGHRAREAHTREELAVASVRRDPREALEQWQEAIALYRTVEAPLRLGTALGAVGSLLLELGDLETAAVYLEGAVPLLRQEGHLWGLALALSNLGLAARAQGQPELGLTRQQQALQVALRSGRDSTEAVVRTDLGFTLLTLHRSEEAEGHFIRAVEIHRRDQNARELRLALNGLARAAVQRDALEAAETTLADAFAVAVEDPLSEAVLHHTLGHVRRLQRRWPEAEREFARAIEIAEKSEKGLLKADFLLSQGYLEGLMGRPEVGLPILDQGLALYQQYGSQAGEASARARGAALLRTLGRRQEAWERLAPALTAVEQQRGAAARRDHRLAYLAFRQDYFELGRDLLLELHDGSTTRSTIKSTTKSTTKSADGPWLRKAFEIDERRRSRELLASVATGGLRGKPERERVARQQALGAELRAVVRSATTPEEDHRLSTLITEWHQLQGENAAASVVSLPALDAIQGALDEDTVLLVYSLGEEQSVLWQVSRETLTFHRLPPRFGLEQQARNFARALALPTRENLEFLETAGPGLARTLLGPAVEAIRGKRLGIIAEGELQVLSFAALPDPDPAADGGGYLVEGHEIGRLPSAAALPMLRRRLAQLSGSPRVKIFADPVFTADDARVAAHPSPPSGGGADGEDGDLAPPPLLARSIDALGLGRLQRLRGAGREAHRLQELARQTLGVAPELIQDFAADRDRFLATAGEPLAVLHIATHALLHPQPELSGLVLAQITVEGEPRDGFLPAVEISQASFPVDLVTLSACQTGISKPIAGEGTMGLSWAFLDAGAGRVLASLWVVGDEATAVLMEEFYRALLRQGLPPTAALRQAQRAMIQRPGSTPYDWAGFLVEGDGFRPVNFNRK